jgi:transglutaminase-like putative cysteine protease
MNGSADFGSAPHAAYLAPGEYVDSDHPEVATLAARLTAGATSPEAAARAIFVFVRDLPYEGDDFDDLTIYRASHVLAAGHGYCVSKASLCAALARAAGVPSRVAFADVANHLSSPRLRAAMGTDIFAWHGYVELWLEQRWVKASPTFDSVTCRRARVAPLAFDGVHDALLQTFGGGGHMAYLRHHGSFHDVPARFLAAEMLRLYPFARDRGISRFKTERAGS